MIRLVQCLLMVSLVSIMGCNVTAEEKAITSSNLPEHLAGLSWVTSADATADVKAAIARQDYRLWMFAGRGERVPGVAGDKLAAAKARCGTQYIQGSTDLVRDEAHMQLLKKANSYAETYNQLMLQYCQ
jgi:hypothetical protein